MASGDPDGLLEGETVIAFLRVRFSGGMPTDIDSAAQRTSVYRQTVTQRHAYAQWARRSQTVGFPIAGPEMILGITQERLVVWRPALLRSRPRRYAGAVALPRIRTAGVHRRVLASVLTLLFEEGSIVGLETMHGTRLREFAQHIPTYTDYKSR